jgi:hypothetical protein
MDDFRKISIIEHNQFGKQDLYLENNKLVLSDVKTVEEGNTTKREYIFSYSGENAEIKTASIITIKTESKSNGVTASTVWKTIKLKNGKIESAYEIDESLTNDEYLTFRIGNSYRFSKYHYAIKDKTKEIIKVFYIPTGFMIEIDGENIGYISLLKNKELLILKNTQIPDDIYFLTMLVYKCYMIEK